MAIYLGDGGARITYSAQPVYFGGQRIGKIYVGDDLIYPDGVPEYMLAQWYSFPEQRYEYEGGATVINEDGISLSVNSGASITDAVVYMEYDAEWESSNDDSWKYAYSYGIAIRGTNLTTVDVYDFGGYYGKYVTRIRNEGWNESFHWKSVGGYTVWTSYVTAVFISAERGEVTKDVALSHSSDLRQVSKGEFTRFYEE